MTNSSLWESGSSTENKKPPADSTRTLENYGVNAINEVIYLTIKKATKYPLVFVHGTGFRDRKHFGYWGRIPKVLEKEGYSVFFGNQDSWGSIEENAKTLKNNIEQIILQKNCEKVNLIAHSKGGLECRYLILSLDMDDKISSLTLISTPNHGTKTMSILWTMPKILFKIVAFL